MQILEQVLNSIQQARMRLLTQGQFLTGWTQQQVMWAFVVLGVYFLVFLVFVPLHRFLKRRKVGLEQALTQQVDEMLYLLAKAQHFRHLDKQALGGDPHLALMKSIFVKGNCDYLQSSELILTNIHKVEQLLGEKIISADQELAFGKKMRSWKVFSVFEALFKRVLALFTLGGYLLFA